MLTLGAGTLRCDDKLWCVSDGNLICKLLLCTKPAMAGALAKPSRTRGAVGGNVAI